MIRQLRLLFK